MVRQRRVKEKRLTLLLHPLRREIYRLVCETPGVYFFELSSTLTAPHGTINWHLRKLEEASLIKSNHLFFPSSKFPNTKYKDCILINLPLLLLS